MKMQRNGYVKNAKKRRLRFGFLGLLYVLVALGVTKSVSYHQLDENTIGMSLLYLVLSARFNI